MFDGSIKTIVLTENVKNSGDNLIFEKLDFQQDLPKQICEVLYRHNLQSVIIEGGAKTLQTFIDANLWDETRVFTGVSEFHEGINAPKFSGIKLSETNLERDTLKIYKND